MADKDNTLMYVLLGLGLFAVGTVVRDDSGLFGGMSASDWSARMAELRAVKPRPLIKMYGRNPTEAQQEWHKQVMRDWNREYRKASQEQKKQLVIDNAEYWRSRS